MKSSNQRQLFGPPDLMERLQSLTVRIVCCIEDPKNRRISPNVLNRKFLKIRKSPVFMRASEPRVFLDTEEVDGSSPFGPTIFRPAEFSTCDSLPVLRSMGSDAYLQQDCVASTLKIGPVRS
jgi:hypothetical protein